MRGRTIAAVVVVIAVVGLLGYALLNKSKSTLAVGSTAPSHELQQVTGQGGAVHLADYRGHWTLVNFWATWCPPCKAEAPLLQTFWERHRSQGVRVVGVDLNDPTGDALKFIHDEGLTYTQLRDSTGYWYDHYSGVGLPQSFLINPSGEIAVVHLGQVDQQILDSQFGSVIGAPATASQ
jgi:cytochrome c biogenesis protein CcmG/thiol:disulfide interchange protein DsbE